MDLKTSLGPNFKGKLLAHVMGWFGEPGHAHRMTRYASNDPYVVERQLSAMKAVGIDGVILTWQGLTNAFLHQSAVEMCYQAAHCGMLFGLLLDPWICKSAANKEQAILDSLNSPSTQRMLSSSAYLPERYVLDFDTGADFTKIAAARPDLVFLKRHVGYSWPEITNTLATLKNDNANPAMKIPGICMGFNDGGFVKADGTRDYGKSVWDSSVPTRVIDAQAGNTYFDQLAVTPVSAPYIAIVTWNDHDEQTGIEQFASTISGVRIA
jgi:hypothetical protein